MVTFCSLLNQRTGFKFLVELALGAFAAIVAQTLTAPIERLKLYLQVEAHETRGGKGYKSAWRELVQDENAETCSIFNLWRGNTAALVKAVPQKALELAMTDLLQNRPF